MMDLVEEEHEVVFLGVMLFFWVRETSNHSIS